MYCINCGNEMKEEDKFCPSCGTVNDTASKAQPVEVKKEEPKKSSNVGLIIGIIVGVLIISIAVVVATVRLVAPSVTSIVESQTLVANTTWIMQSDKSEVVFTNNRINWYMKETDHTDNYYSGEYKFYKGEAAIRYITTELEEYGVTEEEVNEVVAKNSEYTRDNFVVFDIRYDKYILNGKEQTITRPLVPWFGFMSEDHKSMRVANMNTKTYYNFTLREYEY